MLSKEMVAFVFAIVMALAMANTCVAQNSPQDYVDAHNTARADVGVEGVSWDTTVQAYAQNYANIRKADCKLAISNVTGPYGENLAVANSTDASGIDAVNFWVSFKQYYSYANNSCASGEECGTYTQVVWHNTTKIGCARTVCDNNAGVFFICNYSPRGNIEGEKPY